MWDLSVKHLPEKVKFFTALFHRHIGQINVGQFTVATEENTDFKQTAQNIVCGGWLAPICSISRVATPDKMIRFLYQPSIFRKSIFEFFIIKSIQYRLEYVISLGPK
jgi:hypothetical protein